MAEEQKKIIFSLMGVGKVVPPKRQVIRDISLGFFYGAKIGVLGLNGSGKSTLLRIIAGKDPEFTGQLTFSKGYSRGLLEQEPELDPEKTVKEVVEEAARGHLRRAQDLLQLRRLVAFERKEARRLIDDLVAGRDGAGLGENSHEQSKPSDRYFISGHQDADPF